MTSVSLQVIKSEHQALAAMLQSLSMLVSLARRNNDLPDFGVIRSMIFYLDEFPERLHHPKESDLLFPLVRMRVPELAALLDRLDRDHAQGEIAIRDLEHALLSFEVLGEPRRTAFEQALERFTASYLDHMRLEESVVLPAAERVLTTQDWVMLDSAFASNRDPLTGQEPEQIYRPLFQRILMNAPAPVGLGDR